MTNNQVNDTPRKNKKLNAPQPPWWQLATGEDGRIFIESHCGAFISDAAARAHVQALAAAGNEEAIAALAQCTAESDWVHPIIRQIVGRRRVSESNRQVIRYYVSRLKKKYKTYRCLPRQQRHDLLRAVIQVHAANRKLYCDVMSGRVG